ncbi:MAG: hypothetical protein AABW88_02305 [Nanoarchaeota archaeon]
MSKTASLGYYWPSLCDVPSAELETGLESILKGETPRLSRNSITVMKLVFNNAVGFLDLHSKATSDECNAYCFLAKSLRFGEQDKYSRKNIVASEKKIKADIRRLSSLVERLPEIDFNKPREEYMFLKDILGKIKQYSYNAEHMRRFLQ